MVLIFLISDSDISLLWYKKAFNFWILTLNPAVFQTHLLGRVVFSGVYRVFYVHYHIIYKQWQFYFLLSNLMLFIYLFVWLLWLELLILCWMKVVKVDTFIIFLILVGKLLVFARWVWCCCRFLIYDLYYVDVCSLYSHFADCIIINGHCTLSNAFSMSIDMIMWFYLFFCLCNALHLLICKYCTILESLGWIPLDHSISSF